jgi:hypothetical protein
MKINVPSQEAYHLLQASLIKKAVERNRYAVVLS